MIRPPAPPNERQRLETLRSLNILDTPSEERFYRITRLARRLFDVPIALVSLIDSERQWFKSKQGCAVGETSRDISFCGHTILTNNPLIVQDAVEDERFRDNPLVTGDMHIRFYAGYPLTAPDGSKLGSLCIIDREARQLSDDDVRMLTTLGQMVESELIALNLSTNDSLTGLYNRRGFLEVGRHTLAMSKQFGHALLLLYVQIEPLTLLRPDLSLSENERVQVEIAQMLQMSSRESDVVARLGSNEFCALFPRSEAVARIPAVERLRATVDQLNAGRDEAGAKIAIRSAMVTYSANQHPHIEELLADAERRALETPAPSLAAPAAASIRLSSVR